MIFANESADGGDFGDARNSFQLVAQIPILETAQISQAALMAAIDERVFVYPACSRGVRTDYRMNVRGQAACDLLHVFQNSRTRPVQIGGVFKNDKDVGITEHGLRPHSFYVRRSQKRGDDGIRDLIFDDVGRLARPGRVDNDFHVGNIGQGVERNLAQGPDTCQHQEQSPGENQEAISRAPVDPAGDHVTSLPLR